MVFRLYASMRNEDKEVMIGEWKDADFFERMLTNFNESDNIERFYITCIEDGVEKLYSEKILPRKNKPKELTR